MLRFIFRRSAVGLLQLCLLLVTVFFLIRLLPADPVAQFVGLNASEEAYAQSAARLGLDRPLSAQFREFLVGGDDQDRTRGVVSGDFGRSWTTGTAVTAEIARYLPVTLELIVLAFLAALLVSVPIGLLAAMNPGGKVDKGTMIYSMFAGSQPEFTWGTLFIYVFFVELSIAPGPIGRLSPLTEPPETITGAITIDALLAGQPGLALEALWYLALPVLTLAFVVSGPIIKMVRESMAGALQSSFIRYEEALGLSRATIAKDALRAALAPALTIIGVLFGYMIGGAVLIESMFSINGIGQYAIRSILSFDYPAIQGVVVAISALTLLVYLVVDLLQASLDPRLTL